ncbi:MAG: hypothetical protein H8E44_34005 [Planctomycetes bacterium]|nr:hypothetical protein [Planctomycetota bacterium]MBL7042987.1 hypothetical protein [Pirellulaceae bacterium]
MDIEHAEKLKREYTDQYVIVDDTRPELRRFKGMTGTVKTVNMNGRALVEFDGNNNRGWYDIDVDFLKVIDEPLPKEEKPAKKAAPKAKKAPSELEKARSEKEAKEPEKEQSTPPKDAPAAAEPTAKVPEPEAEPAPAVEGTSAAAPVATAEKKTPAEAAAQDKPSGDSTAAG